MTFADIPSGTAVLLDANVIVYHQFADPQFGAAATELLRRSAIKDVTAFIAVHTLAEAAHRLMTIEASKAHGMPFTGITRSLKRHPEYVQDATFYADAVEYIGYFGVHVHEVRYAELVAAVNICRQYGLLTNDALMVAIMHEHSITNVASNDADFDRVPGIVRYAPV